MALPSQLLANQPAVLDSLINQAVANNPDLQTAEYHVQAARSMVKSEGWLPDPNLTIALSNLPKSSLALDQTPMSGIALNFSQKIPWPGKLANKKGLANLQVDEYGYAESAWKNTLVKEVKSTYFEYSYWSLTGDVIDHNIELMKQLVDVAQTKYANGEGLAQDVLNAQTSLAKLVDRKQNVIKMQTTALARLNILLNEPAYEIKKIPAQLNDDKLDSLNIDSLVTIADGSNPNLQMSKVKIAQGQKKKALARSDYWPDLMLGFEYRIREKVPMDPVSGEDFVSGFAGISLPLWFWKTQNNKLASAGEELAAAKSMDEANRLKVEYQITDAVLNIKRKYDSYEYYKDTIIPQAEAALESSNIAYQVGKVDFLNLITAQMRLFELQIDNLGNLKDYNVQLAALDELVGR